MRQAVEGPREAAVHSTKPLLGDPRSAMKTENKQGSFRCEIRVPGGGVGAAAFQTAGDVLKGMGVACFRDQERALWLELNEHVGEGEMSGHLQGRQDQIIQ